MLFVPEVHFFLSPSRISLCGYSTAYSFTNWFFSGLFQVAGLLSIEICDYSLSVWVHSIGILAKYLE